MEIMFDLNETCCFIGHRDCEMTEVQKTNLYNMIESLIVYGIKNFLFGSKSNFDKLCYDAVSSLMRKYPHIKRIYIRTNSPYPSKEYQNYLLELYDKSVFPTCLFGANRAIYVLRNKFMIDNSAYCIFYFNPQRKNVVREGKRFAKSGTNIAYNYALTKKKQIFNLFL